MKLREVSSSNELPRWSVVSNDGQQLLNGYIEKTGRVPDVVYMLDQGFVRHRGATRKGKHMVLFCIPWERGDD